MRLSLLGFERTLERFGIERADGVSHVHRNDGQTSFEQDIEYALCVRFVKLSLYRFVCEVDIWTYP